MLLWPGCSRCDQLAKRLLKLQASTSPMDQAASTVPSGTPARAHRALHRQTFQCRQQVKGLLGEDMVPELPAQQTRKSVDM